MTAHSIAVFAAVGFFLLLLSRGLERQHLIRCVMCGARHDEPHAKECPWGR